MHSRIISCCWNISARQLTCLEALCKRELYITYIYISKYHEFAHFCCCRCCNIEILHVSTTRKPNNKHTTINDQFLYILYLCCFVDRFTLLFSHGNAVDLGQMTSFFVGLGQRINCNIFSYDYSGYGMSTGKPTEKNLYADIDAAWHALRTRYGISPENIILYGQSIGKRTIIIYAEIGSETSAVLVNE